MSEPQRAAGAEVRGAPRFVRFQEKRGLKRREKIELEETMRNKAEKLEEKA